MSANTDTGTAAATHDIMDEYHWLQDAIVKCRRSLEAITNPDAEETLRPMMWEYQDRIDAYIKKLRGVSKADLERSQGRIDGIEEALSVLRGDHIKAELKCAQDELTEFKKQNALLLAEGE